MIIYKYCVIGFNSDGTFYHWYETNTLEEMAEWLESQFKYNPSIQKAPNLPYVVIKPYFTDDSRIKTIQE